MRLCIPAETDDGLDAAVCGHFGSAPNFAIVETDSLSVTNVPNANGGHHGHGACRPIEMLAGHPVDAVLVGGIGRGAVMKFAAQRIAVYQARPGTVRENVEAFKAGQLAEVDLRGTCEGHGGRGDCAH